MQNNGGWIALHRKILDNKLWTSERFSKAQAFLDLVLRANHKDNEVLIGNKTIKIKRGEILTSQVKLAERWRWNRKTVMAFLLVSKTDNMIAFRTDREVQYGYTVVTILNYDKYQNNNQEVDSKMGSKMDSKADSKTDTNNNVNNINNNNINTESKIKRQKSSQNAFSSLELQEQKSSAELPLERRREYFIEFRGQEMADILQEFHLTLDGVKAEGRRLYEFYAGGKFLNTGKEIKNYKQTFRNILRANAEKIRNQYGEQIWI